MEAKSTKILVQELREMIRAYHLNTGEADELINQILQNDKQGLAQINELKTEKWKLKQEMAEKDKQIIELLKTNIGKVKLPRENLSLVLD